MTMKRYTVKIKHPRISEYSHEVEARSASEAARTAALSCHLLYGWRHIEVIGVQEAV